MLNRDYSEMLCALSEAKVKFILVGGYALAVHGYPYTTTLDIDFWVFASPENARAVIRALKRFGAPLMGVTEADFEKEGTFFQIEVVPRRMNIITKIDGVSFAEAYSRALVTEWEGVTVHVLSLQDLLANKRATGRLKDLADVELLERLLTPKSEPTPDALPGKARKKAAPRNARNNTRRGCGEG